MLDVPTYEDVEQALARISPYIHRTPIFTSSSLDERCGRKLFFKCENLQKVGAFKFRGACNAVMALPSNALPAGVATHSSGNHAAALSLAARLRHLRATIVMPEDAPAVKKRAVRSYGGEIIFCSPTLEARERTLRDVLQAQGGHEIHPYDNRYVIAGQATAALEMLQDVPSLDAIVAPVGGGGLLAGTALSTAAVSSTTRVFGAEPRAADDAYRSLAAGHIIPVGEVKTIADGLKTSLGERNFAILTENEVSVVTATEAGMVEAMRLVWERMKLVIEPSAAVALAVLLEQPERVPGQRIGIILSGGNVDLDRLPWSDP